MQTGLRFSFYAILCLKKLVVSEKIEKSSFFIGNFNPKKRRYPKKRPSSESTSIVGAFFDAEMEETTRNYLYMG